MSKSETRGDLPNPDEVPWEHFYELIELSADRREVYLAGLEQSERQILRELLEAHDVRDALLDQPEQLVHDESSAQRQTEQLPFEELGGFKLTGRLGRGGMGDVYAGRRLVDGQEQRVAIKLLRGDSIGEDLHQRFAFERAALARLDHPGIARLIDYGTAPDQRPYVVLEYVEGAPIDVVCRERNLDLTERLELFASVCDAVHAAHQRLIVHRDLKPSNILVSDRARLVDFGIAKDLSDDRLTQTLHRRLTPSHASPEQLRGDVVTTASDVYSLGVLLCQLVTDRLPYRPTTTGASSIDQVSTAILTGRSLKPSELAATEPATDQAPAPFAPAQLKGDLDAIASRAMALEPERRYGSAAALADDVRCSLEGRRITARPDSLAYKLSRAIRRNPLTSLASVAAVLLLLAAVIVMASQQRRLRAALSQADAERALAQQQSSRAELNNRMLLGLLMEASPERSRGETVTVLEALNRGSERLLESVAQLPEDRVRLQATLVRILINLGRLDRAEEVLDQALSAISTEQSLEPSLHQPWVLLQLFRGRLTYAQGNIQQAALEFEATRDLYERYADPNSPAWRRLGAEIQVEQATSSLATGDRESAKAGFRAAIETLESEAALQETMVHTLSEARVGLARILAREDNWEPALSMQTAALELMVGTFGELEPEALRIRYERGLTLERLGEIEQATLEYQRAFDGQHKVLGPEHRMVWVTAGRLAAVLQRADRFAEAETLLRGSLASQHSGGIERTTALINLGWVLHEQGKHSEADSAYREAVAGLEEIEAPEYLFITPDNNRGLLALDQKDYVPAQTFLERALEVASRLYGATHSVAAFPLANLGRLDYERGDYGRAEERLRKAGSIRTTALGADHPDLNHNNLLLARLLCDPQTPGSTAQRLDEGLALAEQVVRSRQASASVYKEALATVQVARCHRAMAQPFSSLIGAALPDIVEVRGGDDPLVEELRTLAAQAPSD